MNSSSQGKHEPKLKKMIFFNIYSSIKYIFRLFFGYYFSGVLSVDVKRRIEIKANVEILGIIRRRSSFFSTAQRERRNLCHFERR